MVISVGTGMIKLPINVIDGRSKQNDTYLQHRFYHRVRNPFCILMINIITI